MSERLELKLIEQHNNLKKELKNEYNHLLEELSDLKKQKVSTQEDLNKSIEQIRQQNIRIKEETQTYCKHLIDQAKNEASSIKQGSYNYVETTFSKLESNLENIKNEINAGKSYISKIDKKQSDKKK